MAVNDSLVFATLSACFGPVDEGTWAETTAPAAWSEFLTAARRLLQEVRPLSADSSPIEHAHAATPFSEYLTETEVKALYAPPSFEEKRQFAARHFTGGLPASAVPVESLYVAWTERECALPFAERSGLYRSDAVFVVYPSQRGGWAAQCVNDRRTKSPKLPFPAAWAGQPAEVLAQRSGLSGLRFCHASRFLVTGEDKATVLAACRQVLQAAGRLNG